MLFNFEKDKLLNRNDLFNFILDYKKNNVIKESSEDYINYLNIIEDYISNYSFQNDARCVPNYGIELIKKSFFENLNYIKEKINNHEFSSSMYWKVQDTINMIEDLINGNVNPFPIGFKDNVSVKSFEQVLNENNEYYKDKIICFEEKEVIMLLINELKMLLMENK